VIKLRDQKQLDFEELSAYLSAVVAERDRLAALNTGHTAAPVGISTFLRDKVDQLRGTDDIHTRRERIRKMDIRIKEVCFAFAQLSTKAQPLKNDPFTVCLVTRRRDRRPRDLDRIQRGDSQGAQHI
jgi:hypothetical protein